MALSIGTGGSYGRNQTHIDQKNITPFRQSANCGAPHDKLFNLRESKTLAVDKTDFKWLKGSPGRELIDISFPHSASIRNGFKSLKLRCGASGHV
jgi:hypothetical protein